VLGTDTAPDRPETGCEIASLATGNHQRIWALAVLPDGCIASGSDDQTIRLWDLTTNDEVGRLDNLTSGVLALTALHDGQLVFSIGAEHCLCLWNPKTGKIFQRWETDAVNIRPILVLPDGRLASSSACGKIQLWDPASGLELGRMEGHTDTVWALAPLSDGRLVSGSHDKTIRIWDPTVLKRVFAESSGRI
jgi:WD40 repeat protein